ncbi:hypothetical protein ASF54_15450 [Frondihabitans sp. Leaf304]|nr:hypothetical protein ASF54_15450 [Frondihabitans sp. Leaf304]
MNRLEGATEIVRSGSDDGATRRAVERGLLVRLARGCHVRAVDWSAADRDERFRLRIQAARLVTRGRFVLSHAAAAYAWGLPWVGDWPRLVDVTDPERSTTRSTTATRCHTAALEESETVSFDGFLLTSLARTVIDVALTVPFSLGVVVADAALNSGHVIEGQFTAALDSRSAARRFASATHVVRFADRLAGSAAESLSRVGVHARGAPRPLLQKKFHGSHGATAFGDLFWEEVGVLGECDGDQNTSNRSSGRSARWNRLCSRRKGGAIGCKRFPRCDGWCAGAGAKPRILSSCRGASRRWASPSARGVGPATHGDDALRTRSPAAAGCGVRDTWGGRPVGLTSD